MKSLLCIQAAVSSLLATGAAGLSPAEWRTQSVYQVVTDRFARTDLSTTAPCNTAVGGYCGGTWQGLIQKLDYIQGMGFTAVWISPMVKNIEGLTLDGDSYHGYWAQDIDQVNPHFGSEQDLKDLSDALHKRGMYLMLDIVTNHMGFKGPRNAVDYSSLHPFDQQAQYHPPCAIDYNNQTSIQVCWQGDDIVSLPDMRTEDGAVRATWNQWIAGVVAKFGVDGLRVDSVKHVEKGFWPGFAQAAGGLYMAGEVLHGDPAYVAPYQDVMSGLLNYPLYFWVTQAFQSTSGSMWNLANGVNSLKAKAKDMSLYAPFLENHDQRRFPNLTSDAALIRNAVALPLLMDGVPVVYQGQEQGFAGGDTPNQREALWLSGYNTGAALYGVFATLNRLRSHAIAVNGTYVGYNAWPIYTDDRTVAFRKGFDGAQIVSVFTNAGTGGARRTLSLPGGNTGYAAGARVTDVLSCEAVTVGGDGALRFDMAALPRAFFPSDRLQGSGLCGASSSGGKL